MINIQENINRIRLSIQEHVKLVCVSKFHPVEDILTAYKCGERYFGENRPQELVSKVPELPEDIKWQFIGNLQTNKVKYVVGRAALIHSVDSFHLAEAIQKECEKKQVEADILIEVNVAGEDSKFGVKPEDTEALVRKIATLPLGTFLYAFSSRPPLPQVGS